MVYVMLICSLVLAIENMWCFVQISCNVCVLNVLVSFLKSLSLRRASFCGDDVVNG